ncbi:MAG: hypothetical protein FWD24_05305, partial [Treponema sp.]|nr:hypothetical protein [Treponema sp.]
MKNKHRRLRIFLPRTNTNHSLDIEQQVRVVCGKFFVLFIVLCSLFIVSCPEEFDPYGSGLGSLSLSFSSPRTILPGIQSLNDFTSFELIFTPVPTGIPITFTPNITGSNLQPITIAAGNYNLTVNAYKGSNLAARETVNGIQINAGQNTNLNITLKALPLIPASGVGTFSWNITVNTPDTTATMTIINSSNTVQPPVENLSAGVNNNSRPNLPSGIYTVKIEMTQTNGKKLVWHEILHIYATMTSNFTKVFNESDFNNPNHVITFFNNDGSTITSQTVLHGGLIPTIPSVSKTADVYLYLNSNNPSLSDVGFILNGWRKDDQGSAWNNLTTIPIHESIDFYPSWIGAIDVPANLAGTNDFEKAMTYVNTPANAGAYTLYVRNNANIDAQTINSSSVDLTIRGMAAPVTVNGAITLNNGSLRLGENITVNNVTVSPNTTFEMSANATVTTVTLNAANAATTAVINIPAALTTGGVGTLNLRGNTINAVDFWNDKTILQGAGLTSNSDISKFVLGNFINSSNATQAIGSTHVIQFESGTPNRGVLRESQITIDTQPVSVSDFIVGSISGNLTVTASIIPTEPLSYQWYSNNTPSYTGSSLITGETNSSFTIPTNLTAGTYYYYCVVSAATSAASTSTNIATVNVRQNQNISNLTLSNNTKIYGDTPAAVTVEYNAGFNTTNSGAITIYYNGSQTIPLNVGTYNVTVSTAGGTIYAALAEVSIGTLTITPRQLTINAPTGSPAKVYDGTTAHTGLTAGTLTNVVPGDVVNPSITSATYNSADAATANQIIIVYGITGAAAANYIAPVNGTIAGTITKASGAAVSGAPTVNGIPTENSITVNAV